MTETEKTNVTDESVDSFHETENSQGTDETSHNDALAEGDIGADYIEELLDICDIDGDIDIEFRNGRSYISINSDESKDLQLLSKPETVNALQELTRLAVHTTTSNFSRLILDIGKSRETRHKELENLVNHAVELIEAGASRAALPPMSSYERKIVHDLISERGFTSESEGEGRDRYTVVRRV